MSENLLDLSTWLAELEADRAKLDLMIAEVRRRLGQPPEANGQPAGLAAALTGGARDTMGGPSQLRSDTFFRLSVPEAIKKYLAIMKRPQSPKDIAAALKQGGILTQAKSFYVVTFGALKRLRAAGEVINNKEGWGLAEWYPNKPKQSDAAKAKGKSKKKKRAGGASKPPSAYTAFMGARMKAGASMKDAAAAWKTEKAANAPSGST